MRKPSREFVEICVPVIGTLVGMMWATIVFFIVHGHCPLLWK